jgi:hypothetical protein
MENINPILIHSATMLVRNVQYAVGGSEDYLTEFNKNHVRG